MMAEVQQDIPPPKHEVADDSAGASTGKAPFEREALLHLLKTLDGLGYRFITATPGTHTRVVSRADRREARSLRDVLGWSLPCQPGLIPAEIESLLQAAGALEVRSDGKSASRVRVSSVHDALFLHSAFPTLADDSVFLGPDSYRFADFIGQEACPLPAGARILDYGAGAGVGGITAALHHPASELTLADINPKALFLSAINAAFAGVSYRTVKVRTPAELSGDFDLIVTHPPFMMDDQSRAYRDGGDLYGSRLSLDWSLNLARKLRPGGQFIMHTGVSIVEGRDVLLEQLKSQLDANAFHLAYRELDPDIFSEDLDQPAYAQVERIAAVGAVITRT